MSELEKIIRTLDCPLAKQNPNFDCPSKFIFQFENELLGSSPIYEVNLKGYLPDTKVYLSQIRNLYGTFFLCLELRQTILLVFALCLWDMGMYPDALLVSLMEVRWGSGVQFIEVQ